MQLSKYYEENYSKKNRFFRLFNRKAIHTNLNELLKYKAIDFDYQDGQYIQKKSFIKKATLHFK